MKCKCCEAELVLTNRLNNTVKCQKCKEITTLPKENQTDEVLRCLENASMDLFHSEFDKAYDLYQEAIKLDEKEPEAYFGLALASHRIRYIRDLENECLQPICYEINDKKFSEDENYIEALRLASLNQRHIFEEKARKIDYIKEKFDEFENNNKYEFDSFLCLKITKDKDSKEYTEEKKYADSLFKYLTNQGLTPFYSEVYCKEQSGSEYEAIVLYALYKVKSLIILCSKEDYLRTTYVQNEYMRYFILIDREEKERESFVIAYKGNKINNLRGVPNIGKMQQINIDDKKSKEVIEKFITSHKFILPKLKTSKLIDENIESSLPSVKRKRIVSYVSFIICSNIFALLLQLTLKDICYVIPSLNNIKIDTKLYIPLLIVFGLASIISLVMALILPAQKNAKNQLILKTYKKECLDYLGKLKEVFNTKRVKELDSTTPISDLDTLVDEISQKIKSSSLSANARFNHNVLYEANLNVNLSKTKEVLKKIRDKLR